MEVGFLPRDFVSVGAQPGVADRSGLWIKRVGGDGLTFARDGVLGTEAIFETKTIDMESLTEVFGLCMDADFLRSSTDDAEDFIDVQVNAGGGYLGWDGINWVPGALAGPWVSLPIANDNFATLATSRPGSLSFRIRLRRNGDNNSPRLKELLAYVQWQYDAFVDIHATLKQAIETARAPITRRRQLTAAAASFSISSEYSVDPAEPIEVFNITTDPNRAIDLFQSYNAVTDTITMTAPQGSGDILEFTFGGFAPVGVVRRDEVAFRAQTPYTTIRVGAVTDTANRNDGFSHDFKVGMSTRRVRTRRSSPVRDVDIVLEHITANPRDALVFIQQMIEAVNSLRSVATGESFYIIEDMPADIRDYAAQSIFGGRWGGSVRTFFHNAKFIESPMVQQISVNLGDWKRDWRSDLLEIVA